MILAARELRDESLEGKVTFAFVADEERGGDGIRDTKPKLGAIDAAVIGEPTGARICTAQRGMLILRCSAHGEAAHVAHAAVRRERDPQSRARYRATCGDAVSSRMRSSAKRAPQVTQISGGLARNQVPDRCEFFVDLRTTPNLDHAELASGDCRGARKRGHGAFRAL